MELKRSLPGALETRLGVLKDRRVQRTQRHPLAEVLFMAFCGVLAGCNGWDALAGFSKSKRPWFEQWFDLPSGTPSSDTFQRVLESLEPEAFAAVFEAWLVELQRCLPGELLALDGKALKGAFANAARTSVLHLLHVWSVDRLVLLGQVAVAGAPGELAGIEKMLATLEVAGAVLATDANGCTKKNAAAIVDKKADYLFGLKGNRGRIHEETKELFNAPRERNPEAEQVHRETDKGHGRLEVRETRTLPATLLSKERRDGWEGLQTLVCVERTRTIQGETTKERQYYLSSQTATAEHFAAKIRSYWSVENQLHWVLDVTQGEDRCRVRDATAAQNIGTLRRYALRLLRHPTAGNGSIVMKQRSVGWDDNYLLKLLIASTKDSANQAK